MSQRVAACCSVLQYVVNERCTVHQRRECRQETKRNLDFWRKRAYRYMCCSVLQCVELCCTAAHCNTQQINCWRKRAYRNICCCVLQCVAVCCALTEIGCKNIRCHVVECIRLFDTLHLAFPRKWKWKCGCGKCPPSEFRELLMCMGSVTILSATTHCNILQHAATYCSTLQHTATRCNTHIRGVCTILLAGKHCNILQQTATHCNALRHTAANMSRGYV